MYYVISYTVLYRDDTLKREEFPYIFRCMADDVGHAEEQCRDAEPNCEIVWAAPTEWFVTLACASEL